MTTSAMRRWLQGAGIYNVLFGVWVILFPFAWFDWSGLPRPNHPWLWQCIGMIVGVYGVGYWLAASDPLRHWPVVFVGLLGKIFGPIGFVFNAIQGDMPWLAGVVNITNDLIWLWPFACIVWAGWQADRARLRLEESDPT
jgi:small multidrug resistance pump